MSSATFLSVQVWSPSFSSAPWLEYTDHDPVELSFRIGKDWAGEAKTKAHTSSRPDVLRFMGCSKEAVGLRTQYSEVVAQELEAVSGTQLDWDVVTTVMKNAAFKVLGPTPTRHLKPWLQGKEVELRSLESRVHTLEVKLRDARLCKLSTVETLQVERRKASSELRAAKRRWEAS